MRSEAYQYNYKCLLDKTCLSKKAVGNTILLRLYMLL